MAVTFISNGYDTTVTNPYSESVWADAFPTIGLASYGVRSPTDWKVAAVAGQDRTVSIAAGRGFGHGVTDKTVANETIQLDTISSGSRWDLIACRRDWTPTAGVSQFVKVNGGATATIPGGRVVGPGNIDDQPIALVQVTAGETQPSQIIDLRTWSGDGGGLVANHDLVRSFLNAAGTRINILGVDWLRRVGANDTNEWFEQFRGAISYTATDWVAGAIPLSTSTDGNNILLARITIPDPGFPYHVQVLARLEGGKATTRWDANIGIPGQPQVALAALGHTVAPWYDISGFTITPITGSTTVDLNLVRLSGTESFGLTTFNRAFRAMVIPATL